MKVLEINKDYVGAVVNALLWNGEVYSAIKYMSPKLRVKATMVSNKNGVASIVLSIGRPNYRERLFVKGCMKVGEPFPVKKVELVFKPKRKTCVKRG